MDGGICLGQSSVRAFFFLEFVANGNPRRAQYLGIRSQQFLILEQPCEIRIDRTATFQICRYLAKMPQFQGHFLRRRG